MRVYPKKKNLRVKIFFCKKHAGKDFFAFPHPIYTGQIQLPIDTLVTWLRCGKTPMRSGVRFLSHFFNILFSISIWDLSLRPGCIYKKKRCTEKLAGDYSTGFIS